MKNPEGVKPPQPPLRQTLDETADAETVNGSTAILVQRQ